jgi:Holliday junction resolvase RusA-like endonuclease
MFITLSLPPPLNQVYRFGKGKYYKTKEAKDWETEVLQIVKFTCKKHKTLTGNLYLSVFMYLIHDRDIDSSLKTSLDALQRAQIYKDDKQIIFLNVQKLKVKKNPRLEIEVKPI